MEEKISYRKLGPKDLSSIYNLSSTVFLSDFPTYSPKTAKIYGNHIFTKNYYKKVLSTRKNLILGAFIEKKLAGFICLKSEIGGVVYIDVLFIGKDYRKKGIGTKLLGLGEIWALQHKNHYLWLDTETPSNIEFYKNRGFIQVGTHPKAWFGEQEHIMGKILRNEPFPEVFQKYPDFQRK